MSDFHMVLFYNEYYIQIIVVFDETDAEQKQTDVLQTHLYSIHVGIFFPNITVHRVMFGCKEINSASNSKSQESSFILIWNTK